MYGTAKINENKELDVISNDIISKVKAKNIIIATGASPKKINISNESTNAKIWNYFDAMTPNEIPENIGIVGSGAIGIEFASFYNSLGSNVKVFEMQNEILNTEDFEVSEFLRKNLIEKVFRLIELTVLDIKENENFRLSCKNNKNGK